MEVFWLVLAVFIWGFIHSVLASMDVKNWLRDRLGDRFMLFYRFVYNVFSVLSFVPILWLAAVLPDRILYKISAPWMYLFLVMQGLAALMLVVGVLHTDSLSFVGLRQMVEMDERPSKLVTHGLYHWMRHPLYTAGLLFIWLTPVMSLNSLVLASAATIYILVGAHFEERKLLREFGEDYAKYRASTPMLIPGLTFKRNK